MSQPDPIDFGKHINQEEASQLAMRGALDTIHKLQEITEGLRAQLRDTANQNRALQEQLQELRIQQQAWQQSLQKPGGSDPMETQHFRTELSRAETHLKESYRDKEIHLMQQWMEKENQLTDEFRQKLQDTQKKLEEEHVKHRSEIQEVEQRWEAYAREKQTLWESRAKESLAEIERYDSELLKNLLSREMNRLEGRLSRQAEQITILERIQLEKQQALALKENEKIALQAQLQELLAQLNQSRLENNRAENELEKRKTHIGKLETEKEEMGKRFEQQNQREVALKGKLRQVIDLLRRSRDESLRLQTHWAATQRLMEDSMVRRVDVAALHQTLQDAIAQHAQQRLHDLSEQIQRTLHLDLSL